LRLKAKTIEVSAKKSDRMSFHDLIGESRSFDKLRMTGLGACPGLDTGVKPNNDKLKQNSL